MALRFISLAPFFFLIHFLNFLSLLNDKIILKLTLDLKEKPFEALDLKEIPFKAFANRTDPDQAALVRAA